ncbi:MAG: bifunctional UDP-N-acetylmuramoyl-tripeptide:D-alanyl-D-alanine ligase/alanine racemase [Marinoscillum sp.]
MLLSEIAKVLSANILQFHEDMEIRSIIYDSRKATVASDQLFVALSGQHHDGHDFIQPLIQKGLRNFLVSKSISIKSDDINVIQVSNVLQSLQQLAAYHRGKYAIPIIGIAGSNGKTIVKEWLSSILSRQWQVVKSPKSFNSQLGVPLSVWEINANHQVGVFETGVSESGEMQSLENILKPTLGIFTNIGEAHAEGFESLSAKLAEKALLFNSSKQIICRYDHLAITTLLKNKSGSLISWGFNQPKATLNYLQVDNKYTCTFLESDYSFEINWQNPLDLENLFHAITAAIVLGESNSNIQEAINDLKAVPMRLELKRGQHNTYILDDTYNNDLIGLQVALDYLKQQPHNLKKTVILSDILQSGKSSEELYVAVNKLMLNHKIDHLIGIGIEINKAETYFSVDFNGFNSVDEFLREAPVFRDETILVKGARTYSLERVVNYLEDKNHGTVLEVNFEAITHNLNVYRSRLQPKTKLMVMVKAFAYGVGVEEIAHLLQYHKVDYLGVAYLDEAINLRRKRIETPIMIMNVGWDSFQLLETFNLEPEIYSIAMLRQFIEACDTPPPIHLKIETGMNRLGFVREEIEELQKILQVNPSVKVAGIFTHFSSSDSKSEDTFTEQQATTFDQIYDQLTKTLDYKPLKHAVNSAGIIRWPKYHYDMVRLGIGLYGFDSSGETNELKPISTLKSKISQIKTVKAGASIGYSRKGQVHQDSEIATISIGYADGYTRLFGNGKAYVLINGQQAYTIGNICMDMTMVDVTGLMAKEGDEVIIFGEKPNITELAHWSNTIPYEILTNVSQRVKRVFVSE